MNTLFSILLLILLWAVPAMAGGGAACFDCHDPAGFRGNRVHSPVAAGRCDLCHAPHVSRNSGLLRQEEKKLCFDCHSDIAKKVRESEFIHAPIQAGGCSGCHAPHTADRAGLLRETTLEVCLGCHETLKEKNAFAHQPFADGECNACHDPHASDDFRLLKAGGAQICLDCHADSGPLKRKHLGRSLQGMDCIACHNPHGSDNGDLIRQVRHEPFAQGNCQSCHGEKESMEICLSCHEGVLASFNGVHNHLQGNGAQNPCASCHNPHVGDRPGFFPDNQGVVCRSCHRDTFERRRSSLHKHPVWNVCTDCHTLHGSNRLAMLKSDPDKVCAGCHESHATFTHPIGEEAIDPRSGEPMGCISCHDSNAGTMYKFHLRGGAERGLCISCHRTY